MQKILLLTSFILLFNTQLFAQEQKVETPNILGQSAQDLTSQLQKEIEEKKPFDEKKIKIDLESLGLDDVDKKKEEIVAQKPIIEEIKKTKEDSLPPLSNSADLATILKEKPQEINIAKIKEMAEIEVKKIEEKSLEVKKNLVENKQENQASAIVASLESAIAAAGSMSALTISEVERRPVLSLCTMPAVLRGVKVVGPDETVSPLFAMMVPPLASAKSK